MLLIALIDDGDEFTGASGRPIPNLDSFRVGLERRLLAAGAFLAPVRQQHLHGRGDDGADRADRLAGQLRAGPDAAAQGLDRHRLRAADLRAADGVPGRSRSCTSCTCTG